MTDGSNLDEAWELSREVLENGMPLELTEETRALLSRTAWQVAIDPKEAEEALRSLSTAMTLLREIHQRIGEGSQRLMQALNQAYDLRDKGGLDEAQQLMRDVLAVEVVPSYRAQAEGMLEELSRFMEVRSTGRLDPDLPDRPQLSVLAHRIQQGHALERTDALLALLRRTAPTAAVSDAETEDSLKSPEGTEALMGMILSRFQKAERRFLRAMYRMTSLRDAGDLEGARQQMRDVLAVEIVPLYRDMAEEQLRGLDSPSLEP